MPFVNGRHFKSEDKAFRYLQLLALEYRGEIERLECDVQYPLEVNGELVATYVADFQYLTSGLVVAEKVRSGKGRADRLEQRLVWAIHGIKVQEVRLSSSGRG